MSFYVLSLTDPLTHSIIKFTSRCIAITSLAFIYGLQLTPMSVVGIVLAAFGSLSYTFSKHEFSQITIKRIQYGILMILLFFFMYLNSTLFSF